MIRHEMMHKGFKFGANITKSDDLLPDVDAFLLLVRMRSAVQICLAAPTFKTGNVKFPVFLFCFVNVLVKIKKTLFLPKMQKY